MTVTSARFGYDDLRGLITRVVDVKHAPEDSTLDVLWTLYDRVLDLSPERLDSPDRDRFYLSKGHNPGSFYAVLAAKGYLPDAWLDEAFTAGSRLGGHPDRTLVPGAEISSGSLGHGLPLAVGTALGLRAQGLLKPRIYVLLGDAELDEGTNHEAMAYAGATGLDNITVVVVDNGSASHGWPGGIASRFTAQGWSASEVDGRDHDAIEAGLRGHHGTGPHAVVAFATSSI
ncbi:transketolase [Phytomonospora endophytica]|uniref:Transketolase n=1 Tax=Phytomonospora endophytica TaxID=714109 RepID=A0A841FRD9_9ACTN|nr:transketolase [Phytomonospora endophytica]MBB6035119.1 transketolase [Phytomonospora endophytica]GIG64133.1 transketolase [Phytomonospora endophytica]